MLPGLIKYISVALFTLSVLKAQALSCTAFACAPGENVYLCKNLDWHIAEGLIIYNPVNYSKKSFTNDEHKSTVWNSKYSSITFTQFGAGLPLGGLNRAGLAVEELSTSGTSKPAGNIYQFSEFSLIQYLLDNFGSIKEIENSIDKIELCFLLQPLHYILADRSGDFAVVELVDGKLNLYRTKNNHIVLSNNPYEESLKYLKNFTGFGGKIKIPTNPGSNDRFVKLNSLLYGKILTPDEDKLFSLLDEVKQDDTVWQLVYDIHNYRVFIKTIKNIQSRTVAFPDDSEQRILFADIDESEINFFELSSSANTKFLKKIRSRLTAAEIEFKSNEKVLTRMLNYSNSQIEKD